MTGRAGGRGGAGAALVPFDQALTRYEPLIGLEVHVELGTVTKMFCGCPARFGGEPNSLVCPVCLGLPGSLPVTNRAAIEYTIRIGLALNCTIADWCRFARKNYFYPDMPKNFQISQYDEPLCTDGWLDIVVEDPGADGGTRQVRVGIERVHLEEDTGKSLHVGGAGGGRGGGGGAAARRPHRLAGPGGVGGGGEKARAKNRHPAPGGGGGGPGESGGGGAPPGGGRPGPGETPPLPRGHRRDHR